TLPDSKKGKDYDGECAAYYLSRVRSTMMDTFRSEYATNTAYTLGQWGEEEDVRVFLKDNGKSFSKVKFTYPLIQPTVTRLRGAADNLSISAIAIPATQFAQTR